MFGFVILFMRKTLIYIFPLVLLLGVVSPLQAQLVQPARLELELNDMEEYYAIISVEEKGVILYREDYKESRSGRSVYEILCFDTELNEKWSTRLEVKDGKFRGYEYNNGKLYFLFLEKGHKEDTYQIFTIDVETSLSSAHKIENAIPLELTEFTTVDNVMLLGGYVNFRPTVIFFDLNTEKYRVVPGLYTNNSELLEIKADEKNKTFTILHTERMRNRQYTISSKTFDRDGNPLFDYRLKPDADRNLLYGRTTSFGDDALHIAGTYSHGNTKFSRGVFIANLYADGSQKINYYNYGDLENFFSYMKAKRAKRVKDRIKRRKVQGKKIKLNYKLLVHDVIEKDNANILLGEAFYPKYSNRTVTHSYRTFNDYYNPMAVQTSTNLEGYRYTHAVLIGFDEDGKLLWDNSFEINDVLSPVLQKYVQVLPFPDYTVLLYMYENVVRSKIIKKDEVLEGKHSEDIATLYENDEVKDAESGPGGLEEWYDDYFYAYGVQRIRNPDNPEVKMNRKVFYVNKITYQAPEGLQNEVRRNTEAKE